MYLQQSLRERGIVKLDDVNVYLLMLSSWKVNVAKKNNEVVDRYIPAESLSWKKQNRAMHNMENGYLGKHRAAISKTLG